MSKAMNEEQEQLKLNKEQIKGQIKGLNTARIRVWGIGYDNDETALMMRRFLSREITELQEMLDIDEEETTHGN